MNESPQSKPTKEDAIISIPTHPCCTYKKCLFPNKEGGLTLHQQDELLWEDLAKGECMHLECYIRHVLGRAMAEQLIEHSQKVASYYQTQILKKKEKLTYKTSKGKTVSVKATKTSAVKRRL